MGRFDATGLLGAAERLRLVQWVRVVLCCVLRWGATRLLCLKLFRGSAFPARLPGLAALRFSCTLPT